MKRYAFSITIALVCFIGGYATCYSKMMRAQHAQALERELDRLAAIEAVIKAAPRTAAHANPKERLVIPTSPVDPKVEGWNQGLIQPTLPPKRVAP